ncbi:ABC transporter ATP-binding protein [Marinomonas transparens]|uniref:Spermidine/putrescine import ATP-binding protein PotA n=1 Tax=Marinomonas transparens TaxID=2795388 RepID=A0A934JSS9_9GAMM|nr:ABC transporter ATP-binding protein [Marinomonas transparens]MBJ7537651.1 ABC transporter ATP-binding protein [Marinomonas transparens]
MSFLRLEGLVKRFDDFVAVEGMNLNVEKGEFVSLLGPSGCGKTTTLQMIAGFVTPTQGRILINNQDVTHLKPSKRNLGIVFQSYALFHHMTIFDNVAFGLKMRKIDKVESDERVREILSLVHLKDFAHRYPRELSGGQQQRVALARAMVIRPEVLLLDEPLSALDAKIREDMQTELRSIQRTLGTTTILVTHDQSEAMALSDRVAVMNKARLAQIDKPFALYEHPRDSFVTEFLGKSNVFEGSIKDANDGLSSIDVSGLNLLANNTDHTIGQAVDFSIRPEKIRFVAQGKGVIDGTISSRIFLGNQWVFQVETSIGEFSVVSLNTSHIDIDQGSVVGLDWTPSEVRLLTREVA